MREDFGGYIGGRRRLEEVSSAIAPSHDARGTTSRERPLRVVRNKPNLRELLHRGQPAQVIQHRLLHKVD
jgi:hypothetical protein